MKHFRDLLSSDLCAENVQKKFDLLMFIEEVQMEVDIRKYDMSSAPMEVCRYNPKLFVLEVSHKRRREKRPLACKRFRHDYLPFLDGNPFLGTKFDIFVIRLNQVRKYLFI